jgi:phage-related protein
MSGVSARHSVIPEIVWWGQSRKEYLKWPPPIREDFDQALADLQDGRDPKLGRRPMKSIAAGVFELKEEDTSKWYRMIYRERIEGRIFILTCFEKQSAKTSKPDLRTATDRLKKVNAVLLEEKRNAKRKSRSHH